MTSGNTKQIITLCPQGRISLYCFTLTLLLVLVPTVPQIYYGAVPKISGAVFWGPILYYAIINMVFRLILKGEDYQIASRASFLGFAEAVSILLICFAPLIWKQFGAYLFFLAFFHYSEFLFIAWANPGSLSVDSFILNHSVAYGVAAFASWVEFFLELKFFEEWKNFYFIWTIGIVICAYGELIRKMAIITAGNSFTHVVQIQIPDEHKLVTHGIYAVARHPSYSGWFWWSIGTQIILFNPICLVLYTIVSWKFFHHRIFVEEYALISYYRSDYVQYQKQVPTGLPFIKGFVKSTENN